MSLTNIDLWIGKTLFVPPIIRICQLTGQSQFAISRLFWFIAALDGFYRAETLVSSVIFGGMSVVMMLTASLRADMPTRSSVWFRMLALGFFVIDLLQGARTGKWLGTEFWVFVLIAEYAATIRTIPPHQTKKVSKQARQDRGAASR